MFKDTKKQLQRELLAINTSIVILVLSIITEAILMACGIFTFNLISLSIIGIFVILIRKLSKTRFVKLFSHTFYSIIEEEIDSRNQENS